MPLQEKEGVIIASLQAIEKQSHKKIEIILGDCFGLPIVIGTSRNDDTLIYFCTMLKFDKHIFICTNQRAPDSEKLSCGETHGMEIVDAFKKKLKAKDLKIKIRAQRAGCLGICSYGQTMVVYPEGIFYTGVELTDVDEIIEEHIINNRPVQRLVLDKSKY